MGYQNPNKAASPTQGALAVLEAVLDVLDDWDILDTIQEEHEALHTVHACRPFRWLWPLWRSYVARFVLNLPHTNALIRRLQDDSALRAICGFGDVLPHRTTFNRFIQRLSNYADLVEECFAKLTEMLKQILPGLGNLLAVDSTTVRTHSNPNRRTVSDPEATWTAKTSARAKEGGKEWHFGYKLHMVADAQYGLPLSFTVTTASTNDSPTLPPLMEQATSTYDWLSPKVVLADRGYAARSNNDFLMDHGIVPVIPKRRLSNNALYKGIFTERGVPTCMGMVPMEYVTSHPEFGDLYRCRSEGCHLMDSKAGQVRHCVDEVWVDPKENASIFGPLRRDSKQWQDLYSRRQAIERAFKSMKESRCLERHCVRGLRQVRLHITMSVLAYQATALVRILVGESDRMRWMVRPVG